MSRADIIQIRNVSKSYRVDARTFSVLDGLTLSVAEHELVSVVGASGCGKSTLLRLIVGLDADYRGDIVVDGARVAGPSLERGIVFQEHRLFPWLTVEQNVALPLERSPRSAAEKRQAVRDHLELVGLTPFAKALPQQLSGGMAQRAAMARSLVGRPRILLLDEPFGALDALTRSRLQNELQQIRQRERTTMILVTHDVDEAVYLGDRVVVMQPRPGRIRRTVPVLAPHPRDRRDPALDALAHEVKSELLEAAS